MAFTVRKCLIGKKTIFNAACVFGAEDVADNITQQLANINKLLLQFRVCTNLNKKSNISGLRFYVTAIYAIGSQQKNNMSSWENGEDLLQAIKMSILVAKKTEAKDW